MSNQCIALFTDNVAMVDIINKQTSKHPMIMILVCDLVLASLRHNILFRAYHVPGVDNTRADLISRLQIVDFWKAFADADPEPTHVLATRAIAFALVECAMRLRKVFRFANPCPR